MATGMENTVLEAWKTKGQAQDYPNQEALVAAVAKEAERLETLVANLSDELRSQNIEAFKTANEGNHPPFLETVAAGNRAQNQAWEIVVSNALGEMPEPDKNDQQEGPHRDRWIQNPPISSLEADELAEDLWPAESRRFQMTAACLIHVRLEDEEPIPRDDRDPLHQVFTDQVQEIVQKIETVGRQHGFIQ